MVRAHVVPLSHASHLALRTVHVDLLPHVLFFAPDVHVMVFVAKHRSSGTKHGETKRKAVAIHGASVFLGSCQDAGALVAMRNLNERFRRGCCFFSRRISATPERPSRHRGQNIGFRPLLASLSRHWRTGAPITLGQRQRLRTAAGPPCSPCCPPAATHPPARCELACLVKMTPPMGRK